LLDVVILRLMKRRKDFNNLYGLVKNSPALDKQTQALLADFKKYFDAYPSHATIDYETFVPRFMAWHPTLSTEQANSWKAVINNALLTEPDEDQKANIVRWVADLELTTNMANLVEQFNNGDLDDVYTAFSHATDGWRQRTGIKLDSWIDIPIGDLLSEEFDDQGIKFRLGCLNESMRPLRPGDFGIIAARPDQGKTSFISSEATFWASQLPPDRNVLWLNNEGPGKRIIPSLYRSALNLNMSEMKIAQDAGKLEQAYIRAVGRRDRIRIVDIHSWTAGQVEMCIEDHNPAVVIYDMIDNIRGFEGASRTDLGLELMYQTAREWCVKYDCIGVATSQISNEGANMQFPPMGALKDSKTGKQGACDFQLMIGSVDDPNMRMSRFISLPKNKLRRPDGPADPRAEVIFDALRARYKDMSAAPPTIERQNVSTATPDAKALQEATS